ncbi:hypothetical protein [Candidatus Methylocalor cossyra]
MMVLLVVMSVLLLSRNRDRLTAPPPEPTRPAAADDSDAAPIQVKGQGGEGCEADPATYDVTVTAIGERATADASAQPLYLQDRDSVVRKYFLDLNGVSNAERLRLTSALVIGQRLKVRFVVCSGNGSRYLTFVQPVAAS